MHIPVLLNEVIKCLDPKPNQNFIDATFGEGGHGKAILERNSPNGMVLGIERDPELYREVKSQKFKVKSRLLLVNDSFTNLKEVINEYNFRPVHGILFDLGLSSWHLEESRRGFSFRRDEILDMRYNPTDQQLTVLDIINKWNERDLKEIFQEYGEERFSRSIAKKIIEERKRRPIKTTTDLVNIILKIKGGIFRKNNLRNRARSASFSRGRQGIHPATNIFQALRITVNDELGNLERALPQALEVLDIEGRLAVISFHSLEDRIVKQFFRQAEKQGLLKILTKKPVVPELYEIRENPRSRSAKLRAAIKI